MSLVIYYVLCSTCAVGWSPRTEYLAAQQVQSAVSFLQANGADLKVVDTREVAAPLQEMSWTDACYWADEHSQPNAKVIWIVAQSQPNWEHVGCGMPNGPLVSFNGGNWGSWYAFSSLVAHEMAHTLGATDAYKPDRTCARAPDLMCDERPSLDAITLAEIQKANPSWAMGRKPASVAAPIRPAIVAPRKSYLHRVGME